MYPDLPIGADHAIANAYFALFALVCIVCSGGVLLSKHPLNAAVHLIGVMLGIAGIYALLGSPFLGVIQVLVYAGAIMMLVVFVIMVLNRARDHEVPRFDWWSVPAAILPLSLLGMLGRTLSAANAPADAGAVRGEIAPIARAMFDTTAGGSGYWLLFEIVGVLLLVAIVAAVLLAKRSLDTPEHVAGVADEGHPKGDAHGAH
jgi:NADH-quinone oxidoreductase subunit J